MKGKRIISTQCFLLCPDLFIFLPANIAKLIFHETNTPTATVVKGQRKFFYIIQRHNLKWERIPVLLNSQKQQIITGNVNDNHVKQYSQ